MFAILFSLEYIILEKLIKPNFYMEKSKKDKYALIVLINANIHHSIIVTGGFYTLIYLCKSPFIILSLDEICIRTYKPFYSHIAMFTAGYFLLDLVI